MSPENSLPSFPNGLSEKSQYNNYMPNNHQINCKNLNSTDETEQVRASMTPPNELRGHSKKWFQC